MRLVRLRIEKQMVPAIEFNPLPHVRQQQEKVKSYCLRQLLLQVIDVPPLPPGSSVKKIKPGIMLLKLY